MVSCLLEISPPISVCSFSHRTLPGNNKKIIVGLRVLVLEYYCWYTANIVTGSDVDALSIGSGPVAAVSAGRVKGTK